MPLRIVSSIETWLANDRSRAIWVGMGVAALFLVIASSISPFTYRINDNPAILEHLKQGFYLRYVAAPLTWIIAFLYQYFPFNIEWFPVLLVFAKFISLSLFVAAFFLLTRSIIVSLVIGTGYGVLLLLIISRLDYTAASALLTASSLVFWLAVAKTGKIGLPLNVLFCSLVALAFILRPKAFLGCAALLSPVMLWAICWSRGVLFKRRDLLFSVIAIAVTVFSMSLSDYVAKNIFPHDGYEKYSRFDSERGSIHHFYRAQRYKRDAKALSAAGWTADDFRDLNAWQFFDEDVFSYENVRSFNKYVDANHKSEFIPELKRRVSGIDIESTWNDYKLYIQMIMFASAFLLVWANNLKRSIIGLCVAALFYSGFMFYMLAFERLMTRFGIPFTLAFGSTLIIWLAFEGKKQFSAGREKYILVFSVMMLLSATVPLYKHFAFAVRSGDYRDMRQEKLYEEISQLNDQISGALLIPQPGKAIHSGFQDPFSGIAIEYYEVPVGWSTFSPLFYQQLSIVGVRQGAELLEMIPVCRDIFVLSRRGWADNLSHRISDKFDIEVKADPIYQLRENMFLWQFNRRDVESEKKRCVKETGRG